MSFKVRECVLCIQEPLLTILTIGIMAIIIEIIVIVYLTAKIKGGNSE